MNYIDIIEAIYIVYMYNYFKTSFSIHHPLEYVINNQPIGNFFKHPINTGEYENKICPLGNVVSFILALWILSRNSLKTRFGKKIDTINKIIFIVVFIFSLLMNINAFVYLIPVFIFEYSGIE
uniref:Uncharacterized protein n=1 Tax=viral metagenome TaxID=1070528 RepID=A0A6C0JI21_9ZZZZ